MVALGDLNMTYRGTKQYGRTAGVMLEETKRLIIGALSRIVLPHAALADHHQCKSHWQAE